MKKGLNKMRSIKFEVDYLDHHVASVLASFGQTKVLCTASVESYVPPFLKDKKQGWLTAEYRMLPSSTQERTKRETSGVSGRTAEIQRLIGRSLRAIVDLKKMEGLTVTIDCDVIQADGGTRTASISGAYISLYKMISYLLKCDLVKTSPLKSQIAAVSVGYVKGKSVCDLCYKEDYNADVDCNIVMNGEGDLLEIQGTAEKKSFSIAQLNKMVQLAQEGVKKIMIKQREALGIDEK